MAVARNLADEHRVMRAMLVEQARAYPETYTDDKKAERCMCCDGLAHRANRAPGACQLACPRRDRSKQEPEHVMCSACGTVWRLPPWVTHEQAAGTMCLDCGGGGGEVRVDVLPRPLPEDEVWTHEDVVPP